MRTTQILLPVMLVAIARSGDAAPTDLAARGLDLFVHAPTQAAAGGRVPVQLRVFGFPTVSTLAPLPGAQVEATWDPETLGPDASSVPAAVSGTCDESGRAHLDIEVPPGKDKLSLLLSARWRGHERTRMVEITRLRRYAIELRVSDTKVVPGGTVSTWVLVRDQVTGQPVAGRSVDVALQEGSVARVSLRLTTDRAGMATTEVHVPFTDDPDWTWTLTARTALGQGEEAEASQTLGVREETPELPSMTVRWTTPSAAPGTAAAFEIQLLDGVEQELAKCPLRYWVGPRGTHAPMDDSAWQQASTEAVTNGNGKVTVTLDTPKTISSRGSNLTVVARTTVQGHLLSAEAVLTLQTPAPEVDVTPELGVLLPGQAQRLFIHATLAGKPIAAEFTVEGHGLTARVRTDERGWGDVMWKVPHEVGATVSGEAHAGCAGDVAATLRIRLWSAIPGLAKPPQPFERCLSVDRDALAVVRPERPMVRAGDELPVRVLGGKSGMSSVVLVGPHGAVTSSAWLGDSGRGAVAIPPFAQGLSTLSAAGIPSDKDKRVLPASVLVLPRVLPRLVAKRVEGGRLAPGGAVVLEADLSDGHGQPLPGSVGAVVFDKFGGTHPDSLLALDTRRSLAGSFDVSADDVDGFLDGDARFERERWAGLASQSPEPVVPAFDPPATVHAEIEKAFREIVQSLEGAVCESSGDPERLRDVRIRSANSSALNPEMLTLVTEAMEEPPVTPGGEPWRLSDLMAIDPQVKYDNVGRRVTRLKLFRVLSALRTYLFEHKLGPDEPMLREPNALLRRLVREEVIEAGALLDPWGHGLTFSRTAGPRIPFLSTVPGFRLVSAGPDGRFGTDDDLFDPFQRVLASKSPYGRAVEEDRLVDAKWDMRVGDETVEAWKKTLEELTGTIVGDQIGEAYGVGGLGTVGKGGGGGGTGYGRASAGIDPGPGRWLPPVRTDDHGHAQLAVPLGDAETTWQIVLIGVPDQATPAVTSVDVPISLPLSAKVNAGTTWIVGDEVDVAVDVRNRTPKSHTVSLQLSASGSAQLTDSSGASRSLRVPAESTATAIVRVRGTGAGTAVLDVVLTDAASAVADRVRHQWTIKPAGEVFATSNAAWVEREATLALPALKADTPPIGSPRLILERGLAPLLTAALESLQPEHLNGARAMADALEVFGRVRVWAVVWGGETHPLAIRARELARQVVARRDLLRKKRSETDGEGPLYQRGQRWELLTGPPKQNQSHRREDDCPSTKASSLMSMFDWLEVAPRSAERTERACWTAFLASTIQQLADTNDPLLLARVVLALQDWPAQATVASALADRLAASVLGGQDGTIVLPGNLAADHAARSKVIAALLTARKLGGNQPSKAKATALWPRLLLERDSLGGYGSTEATRLVVRALLDADAPAPSPAIVGWTALSDQGKPIDRGKVDLAADGSATVPLTAAAAQVRLEATSSAVLARIERSLFRPFKRPLDSNQSPLHLELAVSNPPIARSTASLQVSLRHDLGRGVPVVVRIPLPPGASLAEPVSGVRQVQGALTLRTKLDSDSLPRVIIVPLHFSLSGTVTLPEATGRIDDEEFASVRTPARPLLILPRRQ